MSLENFKTLSHISPGLTDEQVSKALSDWFGTKLVFTHWEYVGDTGKGDSYLSELMRIKIFGQDTNEKSYMIQIILKRIPTSVSRRLTFRSDQFFKNEIVFYNVALPALLAFQSTKQVTDPFLNYAKVFYTYCDGQNDVILLEDVSTSNFGPAVRQKGIDLEHCKITLKTFAKFHAISLSMRDQNPEEFKEISKDIQEVYYHQSLKDWYTRFWGSLCKIAIDAVEREYPNSKYLEKTKEFCVPETYDRLCAIVRDTEHYGVISHGDSWTNNFLFKYLEEKVPLDAIMIDFQLTRCASPVLDISFFIYSCTTKDLRDEHYEELMKYYHTLLAKQIDEMGSDSKKIYSWEMFNEDLKKCSFFGLAFSMESTPFIILDPEDAFNMDMKGEEKFNIDDVWRVPFFKTKEGRLREADNFVHAVDYGYI